MAHRKNGLFLSRCLSQSSVKSRDQVRAVALVYFFAPVLVDEDGIVVHALAGQNIPVIEAGRIVTRCHLPIMPSDSPRFAAPWRRYRAGIELVGQRVDAVLVAVLAGQDGGAARRADRVRAKAVGETHAASFAMRSMFGVWLIRLP